MALLIGLITLFPIYWVTVSALRGFTGLYDDRSTLWPTAFNLDFFTSIWASTNFPRNYFNSIVLGVAVTFITVVVSLAMAYVLSRFKFRGNGVIRISMLIGYMLPPLVLAIPLFGLLVSVGLDDTLYGLGIAHIAMCLPFGVWMMIAFYDTVPVDLEEAAWIDGATKMQALVRIVIPVAVPGIVSVAVFSFVLSFTDYVFGLMLVSSDSMKTLPVGLATIAESTALQRGDLLAGAALIGLPMIGFMVLAGRFFIKGMMAGAVKG